jgi:UDP-glucuronate decarboxylase
MKILIAGGYGFIGSFIADRLYREGHDIYILDNLSNGTAENIRFRHKSFQLDIEKEECETIFRSNFFDVVIFAVTNSNIISSFSKPIKDSIASVIGLENLLHLSGKYNVPKFIFLSSTAVYGEGYDDKLTEASECNPISPYGYHKLLGENLCHKWSELYNFSTTILRISSVYGPSDNRSIERGAISILIENTIQQKNFHIYGDGDQRRDFIYVEDVADAVFRVITSDVYGTYNLSSNYPVTINDLVRRLEKLNNVPNVIYKGARTGEVSNSVIDNQKISRDLDWVPKYSLQEGLEKRYDWEYRQKTRKKKYSFSKLIYWRKNLYQTYKYLMPYVENIIQFFIFAILDFNTFQSNHLIDYKLVYVLMIGMFLGKTQAILACFLTVILYIYENIAYGREFISLFLDNNTLSHIAMYLFFGLVLGYIIDKKNITLKTLKEEYLILQEKYDFLDEVFKETRKIKEQLQSQIIYTEDSIGKIFEHASQLDSLEPEDIFNGSVSVIEQTMKTKAVSIYLISKDNDYLRLVSKSNRIDIHIPNSIEISYRKEFRDVITQKKMVINHLLDADLPILMAPILQNDVVIGVICLNEVSFERLTLYYQNLFEVVIKLISSSLGRAYEYVTITRPNRYIVDTPILWPDFFAKLLASKKRAKEQLNIPYYILEVLEPNRLLELLRNSSLPIRETDCIGKNEEGGIMILLSNTSEKEAQIVIQRLQELGLSIRVVDEDEVYV